MPERLPEFEAHSRGKGDYRNLEIDLLDDGTLYVDAEDDDARVTLYLDLSDLKRLREWCDKALAHSANTANQAACSGDYGYCDTHGHH